MMLPPYRHPQGRSDAPCGHCGASAFREPIFKPGFRWRNPRGSHRRPELAPADPPVYRCLSCWQQGEVHLGEDTYPVQEYMDPLLLAQGGEGTPVLDYEGKETRDRQGQVLVTRLRRKVYEPDPPATPEPVGGGPESFEAALECHVRDYLTACGMTPEHLRAVRSKIPEKLTGALDEVAMTTVNTLLDGDFPERGLLLGGGVGGGKTSALAALQTEFVTNRMRLHAPVRGWDYAFDRDDLLWLNWPEHYASWCDPERECLPPWEINRLGTQIKLLVIDDIHAETVLKTFGKDLGTSGLQRIIALRDTHRLPTFFTTNLASSADLFERYGERTGRRIERLNDAFYFKDLPFLDD